MKKEVINSTTPLLCPQCGGNQFIHPDNPDLESQITCAVCGHTTKASVLAMHARDQKAKELAVEAARAAFGKLLK
jgi:hypothetical protein